jgi:precorrin-2 methylase
MRRLEIEKTKHFLVEECKKKKEQVERNAKKIKIKQKTYFS